MRNNTTCAALAAIAILAVQSMAGAVEPSIDTVEKQFRELPMEARRLTGPLFWMHGDETRAQLEGELQNVLDGHNGTFTTEPRPHKDWLGEGWYRDLGICLDFARKNNLTTWIYDDWWWPSQMMGGRVPPQYGSKRIEASSVSVEGPKTINEPGYGDDHLIAVVAGRVTEGGAVDGNSLRNLTSSIKNGTLAWDVPAGKWSVMKFTWKFNKQGAQQKFVSVDGADPECVDWFLKTVYQPHYDRFKDDFGKTIVGYFYDEPETQGDWGSDVTKLIAERKLDLNKLLVAYKFKLAGEDQTAAFFSYLDCFAESWGRTMYGGMSRWCRDHKVVSHGHFMEHNDCMFDRNLSAGNMMQLQKYSDMGGIDLVCHQVYPGQRNMGLYQMPKIASSISHTYGKTDDLAFCEIFGGYDQILTYPTMKWLADWHQVRGVNFLIPHSFNPRAPFDRDYPPYFNNGGFEPRWPLYRVWADYTNRLSTMLTGGKHVCPIAMLHVGQSMHSGKAIRPEELTSTIQDALYDCDWLNYDAFENDATLSGREIKLHKENYQVLIVPPAEVIPHTVLAKARDFFNSGGIVIGYGFLPTKSATVGKTSADMTALCHAIWGANAKPGTAACNNNDKGGRSYLLPEKPSVAELSQVLAKDAGLPPALEVIEGDTGNWLHVLHRVKSGQDVFLVCNQNTDSAARQFRFRTATKGTPEIWDPMRNEISSAVTKHDGSNTEVALTLEPMESVLLVFRNKDRKLPAHIDNETKPSRIIPVADARPETEKTPPAKLAVVTATYGVPGDARRTRDVRERLQKLIDGGARRLEVGRLADGDDPAFGVVKTLEAECVAGDKRITLKGTDPQTIILNGATSALAKDQELNRLAAGRHYTASQVVADPFTGACTIPADIDLAASHIYLELDELAPEAAASITVNGRYAGGFIGKPFRLNVTKYLKTGANRIEITPFAPKTVRLRCQ